MKITFEVIGVPKPGGSKNGKYIKGLNRVIIYDACDNKNWKNSVAIAGAIEMKRMRYPLMTGPLKVEFYFRLPRPKYHYNKIGLVKDEYMTGCYHIKAPDVLKCARSTEDALTKIVWVDDARIVDEHIHKTFATAPGATITVEEIS